MLSLAAVFVAIVRLLLVILSVTITSLLNISPISPKSLAPLFSSMFPVLAWEPTICRMAPLVTTSFNFRTWLAPPLTPILTAWLLYLLIASIRLLPPIKWNLQTQPLVGLIAS